MQSVETKAAMAASVSAQHAAESLLQVIQELGEQHSNPVLEILESRGKFAQQHKYFVPEKDVAGRIVRAFYHCHASPDRDTDEHGHFHVFIRAPIAGSVEWAHLAGITMNNFGQPLRWFAVNRWVTGGLWINADALATQFDTLPKSDPTMDLTERWLVAMIRFYQFALRDLLEERDRVLADHQLRSSGADALENREIYALTDCRINLLQDLQRALTVFVE